MINNLFHLPSDIINLFVATAVSLMNCQELRKAILNPIFAPLITQEVISKAVNRGYPRRSGKSDIYEIEPRTYKDLNPYYEIYNELVKVQNNVLNFINKFDAIPEFVTELATKIRNNNIDKMLVRDKIETEIINILNKRSFINIIRGDVIVVRLLDNTPRITLIYNGDKFVYPDQTSFPNDYILNHEGKALIYVNNLHIDVRPYRTQIINNLTLTVEDRNTITSFFIFDNFQRRLMFIKNISRAAAIQEDIQDAINQIEHTVFVNLHYIMSNIYYWVLA